MRLASVEPGDQVLVIGAGGSIGAHAVQIARSLGGVVTAADSQRQSDLRRRFGVHRFIGYENEPLFRAGDRYDVIFELVPGTSVRTCLRHLRDGGRYLSGNPTLLTMLRCLWANRRGRVAARFAFARETVEELQHLAELIDANEIQPIVCAVLPLEAVVQAHRRVEAEDRIGAVVLSMRDVGATSA